MNSKFPLRFALATAIVALCFALAGCSSLTTAQNTTNTQAQGRQYMAQVNQVMTELGTNLDDFVDAVSRNDLVSMTTQADRALKTLDTLSSLEATEDYTDIKAKYQEGVDSLRQALTKYVALYTSGAEIDQESLAEVQSLYDKGVTALSDADKAAAEKA